MIDKDPNATLVYFIDWSAWLDTGDTLATSTWSMSSELTSSAPSIVNGVRAIVTVAGGVVGNTYKLVNHIVTTNGLIDDRSLELYVKER